MVWCTLLYTTGLGRWPTIPSKERPVEETRYVRERSSPPQHGPRAQIQTKTSTCTPCMWTREAHTYTYVEGRRRGLIPALFVTTRGRLESNGAAESLLEGKLHLTLLMMQPFELPSLSLSWSCVSSLTIICHLTSSFTHSSYNTVIWIFIVVIIKEVKGKENLRLLLMGHSRRWWWWWRSSSSLGGSCEAAEASSANAAAAPQIYLVVGEHHRLPAPTTPSAIGV